MTVRSVTLPYGGREVEIRIPEGNLVGVFSPRETAPVTDVRMEVRRALAAPIGSPPLQEHWTWPVTAPGRASKLGFRHYTAAQDALDEALSQKGPGARVTVLTQAPDMLPRITNAVAAASE
jgi:hypothetical protein